MTPAIRICGRIAALALSCTLASACAPARIAPDEPEGTNAVATRRYGRCVVSSIYRNDTTHALMCLGTRRGPSERAIPVATLLCRNKPVLYVYLYTGTEKSHSTNRVWVRYRFGGDVRAEGSWLWIQRERLAGAAAPAIIADFIRGISARKPLLFEVGGEQATIRFEEQASRATRDILHRCDTLRR